MSNKITRAEFKALHKDLDRLHARNDEIVKKRANMETRKLADDTPDAFFQLKREQGDVAQRIEFIRDKLAEVEVVDSNYNLNTVGIGNRVQVYDFQTEKILTFEIVGTTATQPARIRIMADSPVGRVLIGKKRGQSVLVRTPDGMDKYRILDIMPIPELT